MGPTGTTGYHCWNLNMNRINDTAEDVNGDPLFNTLDCQGPEGPPGPGSTTTNAVCVRCA